MNVRGARRWALRTVTLVVAAIALSAAAPAAWSHSELDHSDPANGGMVAPGRTVLRLWFGEPVNLRASGFHLTGQDGTSMRLHASLDGADGGAVLLQTDPLPSASYELDWRVLSLDDGHLTTGSLVFGAGLRPAVVPEEAAGLPPVTVTVVRWLDLAALMVAIGALAVSGPVLGSLGELGRRARNRARTIALLAALFSAYAALITPFVRDFADGTPVGAWLGETWATLVDTSWGHLWLAKVVATTLAAVLIWRWARRGGRSPVPARWALATLAVTALLESLSGHASSLPRQSTLAAVLSATHIVAAGVWAGGLVVVVLCVVPMVRRHPDTRGAVLSSVFRTFSPMAAAASVVLLATGLYEAGRHVPRLASLSASVYGEAVAGKTMLLLLALAMAGLNLLMVNRRLASNVGRLLGRAPGWTPVSRRRFTLTVTVEACVLLLAVGLAAILTSTPTAREADRAKEVTALRTASVDGLFLTFEALQSGPDRSRLVVHLRSTVKTRQAPVDGVDVALSGPAGASDRVRLSRVADGTYEGRTTSAAPGAWSATLRVHRRGMSDVGARTTWTAQPMPGTGTTALEIICSGLAITLFGGLVAAVVRVRRRPVRGAPIVHARREEGVKAP